MKDSKHLYEMDLYIPVKHYFVEQGYTVKAEVEDCDITAVKDEFLVIIELKTTLNLDVILQAAIRQRITDIVYIAVPKKHKVMKTKRWKNILYLLRRLEIGLLLVTFKDSQHFVEEVFSPIDYNRDKSKKLASKKRKSVLKEFKERRHSDYNIGGVTRTKILTSYKEKAIHIAALLQEYDACSIKALKAMGTDLKKTASILQNNHYGWFSRKERGIYAITGKGLKDLEAYADLVKIYLTNEKDKRGV